MQTTYTPALPTVKSTLVSIYVPRELSIVDQHTLQIYSLDGRVVQVLDRSKALPMSFDPSDREPDELVKRHVTSACVRDVSWHPQVRTFRL